MDIREMTAAELLALLKEQFFKDIDIEAVTAMNVEQRRAFTLTHADRLMGVDLGFDNAAGYIANLFFEYEPTPLTDNPMIREPQQGAGAWIVELARLLWQLQSIGRVPVEFLPDTRLLGIERTSEPKALNELYSPEVPQLLSWLKGTPYRRIGARVARMLYFQAHLEASAIDVPLADYYTENCDAAPEYEDEGSCDIYINKVLATVEAVKAHLAKGRELGLSDLEIGVVDSMWSFIPHNYPANYVTATREIVEADERISALAGHQHSWSKREYGKQLMADMKAIAEKHDVDLELDDQFSLPLSYLDNWIELRHYSQHDDC